MAAKVPASDVSDARVATPVGLLRAASRCVVREPVILARDPDVKLTITLACHLSIVRASHPLLLPSRSLFGPMGNSNVPLLRRSCVRFAVP